jgi:dUTP pyrophosphatase
VTESVDVPIVAATPPGYAHEGDAGADLVSTEDATIEPGARVTVGTGVAVALPAGYAGFVVPRSGLAARHGITIVNAPGTVDSGYRGEIRVTLLNTDRNEPYAVSRGDRIAQLVLVPIARARFVPVETLSESERGTGGFGSTGYGASSPASPAAGHAHTDMTAAQAGENA